MRAGADAAGGSIAQKSTALVTGGTDGIGKAIARELASESMCVIVVSSDANKGMRSERELREATRNDDVHFVQADLSLIRNVDRLARQIAARWPQLHRLVLCAGIVRGYYSLTLEGVETNFSLNYLSRFALTEALLPCLVGAGHSEAAARLLVVSGAAQGGMIYYNNVNRTGRFGILRVVSQFCEANDLFVSEMARRIGTTATHPAVTVAALKVVVVRTNIRRQFPVWMKLVVPLLLDPILSCSPGEIAESARRLLIGPEFEGTTGALFRHIKRFHKVQPGHTTNPAQGQRLWTFSERWMARALEAGAKKEHEL